MADARFGRIAKRLLRGRRFVEYDPGSVQHRNDVGRIEYERSKSTLTAANLIQLVQPLQRQTANQGE
jgi:hypothetical protein